MRFRGGRGSGVLCVRVAVCFSARVCIMCARCHDRISRPPLQFVLSFTAPSRLGTTPTAASSLTAARQVYLPAVPYSTPLARHHRVDLHNNLQGLFPSEYILATAPIVVGHVAMVVCGRLGLGRAARGVWIATTLLQLASGTVSVAGYFWQGQASRLISIQD